MADRTIRYPRELRERAERLVAKSRPDQDRPQRSS
jgi:hypothetical protein